MFQNGNAIAEMAAPPPLTKAKMVELERMRAWLDERIAASKRKPSADVVTVTPVLAGLLLELNKDNRPVSRRNSADLANDIAEGRFEFNGESIVVSNSGVLLDGQHRLQQVVSTGKSIESVIVFGPKERARYTIDTGKPKSVSNFLAMKGKSYTQVVAAAGSYFLQWRTTGLINYSTYPTKQQILAVLDETPGLQTSAEFTHPCMKTVRSHAVITFCHYVFWKKSSREAADDFILKLIDGDGLRKGDPILYCRNRLIGLGRGVTAGTRAELIFKCWNAHRFGHGVDHCKLTGGKLPKVER